MKEIKEKPDDFLGYLTELKKLRDDRDNIENEED